ncbi:MAG: tRNA uridine-5-carboxymethylaminomethyl(34) synthesis GTPase MnmE [Elusimicrobiota bacterium]
MASAATGDNQVIVAVATPPGRGAIGIVRLSGPGALAVARSFLPAKALEPRRPTLVWARDGDTRLDRILATVFPAGGSYTGEEMVEVSAHGSPYVLARLVELSRRAGARPARPGEFTQRAFINGRLDLAQAEAVCDLIAARTRLSHRAAVAQLEGGLSRRVRALCARVLELTALVEANLDHPDEDIPPLCARSTRERLDCILSQLDVLAAGFRRGRLARGGARVAIVGRVNAGKSSLLNALLGSDRAIVSERAGTTRDTIEETADLDGLEAVLIDTAGLREAPSDRIEREGQARARTAVRGADAAILVVDRTGPPGPHRGLLELVRRAAGAGAEERPVIVALNKSDLEPSRTGPGDLGLRPPQALEVSARTGAGLGALTGALRRAIEGSAVPDGESAVSATSLRHQEALTQAAAELKAARDGSHGELVAFHLRRALDELGAIVGRTTTEDVLGEVFSRFCVGK